MTRRIRPAAVTVETMDIGTPFGEDFIDQPLALVLHGAAEPIVIEADRESLELFLMECLIAVRGHRTPHDHDLRVVDQNLRCTACGLTVDPESVGSLDIVTCVAASFIEHTERDHVWHHSRTIGISPWFCNKCEGTSLRAPCINETEEAP